MNYKSLEWEKDICNDWNSTAPFGLMLCIRYIKGKYHWDLGNAYTSFTKGSCTTLEKAKERCNTEYQRYIADNLERCKIIPQILALLLHPTGDSTGDIIAGWCKGSTRLS